MDLEYAEPLATEAFDTAEEDLQAAVTAAVAAFLDHAADQVTAGALTAAGGPVQGVWARVLRTHVAPVVERLWTGAYSRLATVTDGARGAAGAFAEAVAERTAGFPERVMDRAARAARTARDGGASSSEARQRVRQVLRAEDDWAGQARVISRTEAAAALNAGTLAAGFHRQDRAGGRSVKVWHSRDDATTRPTHAHADGQVQPLDAPFTVGGDRLQFPGDPAGAPGEVINCRCTLSIRPLDASSFSTPGAAPMTKPADAPSFSWRWPEHLTAAGSDVAAVAVSQEGAWEGPIGLTGAWSADDRMLMAPRGGEVRTRPLPGPLLFQRKLAGGHDDAELGYARVDQIWMDGPYVMGRGQIDMQDPDGVNLARKIRERFIRFVSLDVDDATERHVAVDADGTILPDTDPDPSSGGRVGRVYDTWRAMGATIVPHPAFPDAQISMTETRPEPERPTERSLRHPVEMAGEQPPEGEDGGGLVAAGLVLKALDTGRVLMLQRALDEEDPASGMWEWPGGHIEPDDADPRAGAVREWEEETGQRLPSDAEFVHEWDSTDGRYRGHVAVIAAEGDVRANVDLENRSVTNPDDPDNQNVETTAWWELEQIPDMPALRAEVREQTPWAVLKEAGMSADGARTETEMAADGTEPEGDVSPSGGCVVPEPDGTWRAADCGEEGAVPANETGDGPAQEVEDAVADATEEEAAAQGTPAGAEQDPEGYDDPADPDGPVEEPEAPEPGEADPVAEEEPPRVPVGEEVRAEPREEGEPARDIGHGCVRPVDGGQFERCDCADPQAVTADETGGPVRYSTDADTAQFMSLAASAFSHPEFRPDTAWFRDPKLSAPTLITVGEDGRIAGHLALWGVPHVAYQGRKVFAPHSPTRYDRFHVRPIHTTEGLVEVGVLAMGTSHAAPHATAPGAVGHYDSTGSIIGAVRCGEDAHGIWMAGALLPDITPDQRLRLSLADYSGDWRNEGRGLDLKAALAVPAGHEGFHVPKTPVGAERDQYALVASGALTADHVAMVQLLEERITTAAHAAVEAVLNAREATQALAQRAQAAAGQVLRLRSTMAARKVTVQSKGLKSATALGAVVAKDFPGVRLGTKVDTELARNWVDQAGGLPPYVKRVAKHLERKGFEESHAIATAVNVVKKMCGEGDVNFPGAQKINAKSRGEACAAVAAWERMKASSKS